VGRVAFKRRVTPLDGNHVFAFHVSRPSTFRAPGWGALASLSSCCRWRNATSRKLVPFSHRSASRIFIRQPDCIPSPDGDHQFDGGEKQAGLRPLPLPQLQGCSSSVLGRGVRRVGTRLRAGSGPLLPSVIEGKGVRRPWRWQLPRVWLSGLSGFGAASGATSHRGSRKRFLRRRDSWSHSRTDLRLHGLGSLSSPLEWGRGRGPCRNSIYPEVIAAAVWPPGAEVVVAAAGAGVGEPPGVSLPRRPSNVGGCSYLREWNGSSVCNGTLSANVCSLWLSGPEHVCIFGMKPCFFLISSTRTRLSASLTA
jgi:hypothetical protein